MKSGLLNTNCDGSFPDSALMQSPMIFCRVTQTYDAGACMYFYFGFKYAGLGDPVHVYEEIEVSNRVSVIAIPLHTVL